MDPVFWWGIVFLSPFWGLPIGWLAHKLYTNPKGLIPRISHEAWITIGFIVAVLTVAACLVVGISLTIGGLCYGGQMECSG